MKTPFYRSIFTKIILTIFTSFLVILTGGFLLLYANVRDLLKERTDQEKIQSFQQLEQNIDAFGREVEFLSERLIQANIAKIIICEDEEAFNAQKEQMISDVMNMGYEEALENNRQRFEEAKKAAESFYN